MVYTDFCHSCNNISVCVMSARAILNNMLTDTTESLILKLLFAKPFSNEGHCCKQCNTKAHKKLWIQPTTHTVKSKFQPTIFALVQTAYGKIDAAAWTIKTGINFCKNLMWRWSLRKFYPTIMLWLYSSIDSTVAWGIFVWDNLVELVVLYFCG